MRSHSEDEIGTCENFLGSFGLSAVMIAFQGLTKSYPGKPPLLDGVDLRINRGGFYFLTGANGAGKTTVFKLMTLNELPNRGEIFFDGKPISRLRHRQRAFHRRRVGMVFQDQDHWLLTRESIEENVALPLRISGIKGRKLRKRTLEQLERVGLAHRRTEQVNGLSGGEKQLVSIARALVLEPPLFLADEPTGNLDQAVAFKVMEVLKAIHQAGCTVVVATHDLNLIRAYSARTYLIKNRQVNEVRLLERPKTEAAG